MKSNEESVESKPVQPNALKRDYVMLEEEEEDEDIPVLKKKYFHQDSEDEDWDDPSLHKSNTVLDENEEPNVNRGKIIPRSKLYFITTLDIKNIAEIVLNLVIKIN